MIYTISKVKLNGRCCVATDQIDCAEHTFPRVYKDAFLNSRSFLGVFIGEFARFFGENKKIVSDRFVAEMNFGFVARNVNVYPVWFGKGSAVGHCYGVNRYFKCVWKTLLKGNIFFFWKLNAKVTTGLGRIFFTASGQE